MPPGASPSALAAVAPSTMARSSEVSVRAAVPRFPRGAGPPPLASSSTFLSQPPSLGSQAQAPNVMQAAAPSTLGAASGSGGNGVPARLVASTANPWPPPGPWPSAGRGGRASAVSSDGPSPASGPVPEPTSNLTPTAGGGAPGAPAWPVRPPGGVGGARSQSLEPAKPVVKALAIPGTSSTAARPAVASRSGPPPYGAPQVLSSSRSLVPPPARIASSFVPAASRFYSYTPTPGARKTSSFTPSASRAPEPAKVLGTSGDLATHTSVRFLEGLHRPSASPLLAADKAGPSVARCLDDDLMASVRSVSTPPRAPLEGLASGQGAGIPPSVYAYPSRPATSSTAPRASAPTVAAPREARDLQAESSSNGYSNAYANFMSGRWAEMEGWNLNDHFALPFRDRNTDTVPNTAPPLMRYVVNPKDGCVEKLQDTHQPAHVPAVAAAALAALEAAGGGKNAFFPTPAERERERNAEAKGTSGRNQAD